MGIPGIDSSLVGTVYCTVNHPKCARYSFTITGRLAMIGITAAGNASHITRPLGKR